MRIVARCLAAAMLVTLAACSTGTAGPPAPASSMSEADLLAIGKELVQCMRDNGLPDIPDPYVEKNRLKLPDGEQKVMEEKYTEQQFDTAEQACQSVADKLPQGAIESGEKEAGGPPGPGDVEALTRFAECIRQNGVPEWPDPAADGRFPLRGTPLEKENPEDSPRLKGALDACQNLWGGGISIS
ncbi:hypothetical protein QLQ12_20825 [Actinoplanes sp. NEAU-A12]|uniref:Lipoprotein n=1 Tax=Actinoplanes sandaracinus TaxID=3045177 RepID=A0ABT6WMV3_9ACTN|nr:hypothetical protein [Actinoplanes sandaracinus]MDI6101061.1 hypothetical protein [Actinoplanes sandaracinus]